MTCFNLYRPPDIRPGDAERAGSWLDHVHRIYPDDAEHIIDWQAHRVQHPNEKINHALLLGGKQEIGKDTLLEPVKEAVGPWNFHEVSPKQIMGRFNGFFKSVILRILGPLVRNPRNPSRRTRTRHRLLLEMLLHAEQFSTIRQIMAAYPYLRAEWEERVSAAEDRQSLLTNI